MKRITLLETVPEIRFELMNGTLSESVSQILFSSHLFLGLPGLVYHLPLKDVKELKKLEE